MPRKTTANEIQQEKSYDELEKECEDIIEKLADPEIGLDDATKYYKDAMKLTDEMEKRLSKLMATVSDDIKME